MLGIALTDQDVLNVPLLATDPYGHVHPRPATASRSSCRPATGGLVEGNPAAPVHAPPDAVRTGHAFLDDIAHHAVPVGDHDGDPAPPAGR